MVQLKEFSEAGFYSAVKHMVLTDILTLIFIAHRTSPYVPQSLNVKEDLIF